MVRILTREQELEVAEYCFMALEAFEDGSDIETVKRALKVYESDENYLACAGIKKAIDFAMKSTLDEIKLYKTELEWLHWKK